jgi:hypothetical protein
VRRATSIDGGARGRNQSLKRNAIYQAAREGVARAAARTASGYSLRGVVTILNGSVDLKNGAQFRGLQQLTNSL